MAKINGQRPAAPQLDFFVLGASKSGKSALSAYLRTHPQVFLPAIEPNFYADGIADTPRWRPKDRHSYCEFFSGATAGQLLGEVSAWYLFSERAIPNILRDSPDARFIVILRNPVDMAHSLHSDLLRHQEEDESSFQKAWELQDARAIGERIPVGCKNPKHLLYRKRCSFAAQMERLLQWVPRERVLVHIFDEFFSDPKAAYERTLAFLGLPADSRTHFERVNEHGIPRSRLLHRFALRPPFYRPLKRAFNAFGLRPGLVFFRWTVGGKKFASIDPSFRRQLEAEFQPDIARLEAILGRNLDVWKTN